MEAKTLLALLGLCLGMAADAQDQVLSDFDVLKFSGLWYEVAFATKTGDLSAAYKAQKMAGVVIKMEGGHPTLTAAYYNEDHCVTEEDSASQGDAPGKFKVIRGAGNKEVDVVDTDYESYAIMDVAFHKDKEAMRALKLYCRSLDQNTEALRKFREAAKERGFTEADIHVPPADLTCVNLLQAVSAGS